MFQRGDTLQLALRPASPDGRRPAAYTATVVVEGVYAKGGEALYYLCPPEGTGVLVRESLLLRLLQRPAPPPPSPVLHPYESH